MCTYKSILEKHIIFRTEMVGQNSNILLKLILCDSSYLLPIPLALSEGAISEK